MPLLPDLLRARACGTNHWGPKHRYVLIVASKKNSVTLLISPTLIQRTIDVLHEVTQSVKALTQDWQDIDMLEFTAF